MKARGDTLLGDLTGPISSVMTAQRSRYGSGISRAELVVDKHGGRDRP